VKRLERAALAFLVYVKERPGGFAVLLRDVPASKRSGEMPALMYDLADRVGAIFTEQFRKAGYDAKAAPIYAHALVGMVAFVGQWWTESRNHRPWRPWRATSRRSRGWGLRHLPRRPGLLATAAGTVTARVLTLHGRRPNGPAGRLRAGAGSRPFRSRRGWLSRAMEPLNGLKVAILVENGFEQVELVEPRAALDRAGAETQSCHP